MPVSYILSQFMKKAGCDRDVAVRYLNEAARELYTQFDMPGSLMEQVFKVNGDQTLTLPSYVGRLRAVREYASMLPWHINKLRPRYNQFNWPDMWRNFRLKDKQALMATVANESVGVIAVPTIENPPIVVTVSGPTATATLIHESVTMDALSKRTTNNFLDYVSVKKSVINSCDVTLSDIEGNVLTIIPNNELEAQYQIVDISNCPWLPQDTSRQDNYVEILYKKKLYYLQNDDDEFPAFDYDDVVVNKMMQLWNEEQDKPELAVAYDGKANRTAARIMNDQDKETETVVAFVNNPHDTLLRRIGTSIRRRYPFFSGRR